jgi:queuine tRNA-ribosyltransferase
MEKANYFRSRDKKIPLPVFFPDATRAVIKAIDTSDLESTKTSGILVNTYHLYRELGDEVVKKFGGIREFMDWKGAIISDSGGFQVMSIVKSNPDSGSVIDKGVIFRESKKRKIIFTPEKSINFQMKLNCDMVVVLDDFTDPISSYDEAKDTVERTIKWAKRSKEEFLRLCKEKKIPNDKRPYILGVVQGGKYQDLRKYCTEELVKIGFDGLGYGGWPINEEGNFDYESAETIAKYSPKNYLLYGLGVGKPEEIVKCVKLGFDIFDCVLPTRDARHKRLYVYNAKSIDEIDINLPDFYSFYVPDKEKYYKDDSPVSMACDCLLCKKYSKAYLAHLFRIKDLTALRLATIHNLRFYSILMEKLNKG